MDFSSWFEAYLEDRWWTFDARHNRTRIGRVLIATGRDAADVTITTSFGVALMRKFTVFTEHVPAEKPDSSEMHSTSFRA
jgi:transglutaminase-like putative cysteine protease